MHMTGRELALKPYTVDEFLRICHTAEAIAGGVKLVGRQISQAYEKRVSRGSTAKPLLAVGILRACIPFMADLMRQIQLPLECDYICVSSPPQSPTPSSPRLVVDTQASIEGRDVLVVDGIVDEGYTLDYVTRVFRKRHPSLLQTCCLIDKRPRRATGVRVDYAGFVQNEDEFVVGYGLDYMGRFRNLPYVAALNPRMFH